jgi:hypothetical protein
MPNLIDVASSLSRERTTSPCQCMHGSGPQDEFSSVFSGLAIRELIITDDHFWIFCYLVRCTMHAARRGAKLCDDFTGGETANIMSM